MIFGHGDDAFRYGEQIKIDFSSNIYYGADLSGLQAHLASRFGIVAHYPEPEPTSLEKMLAKKLGVPDNTVPANSTTTYYHIMLTMNSKCCPRTVSTGSAIPTIRRVMW